MMSPVRAATIVGLVVALGVGGLVGWLGYRSYQSHQVGDRRELFLQVGKQGAVNLTTIDWENADSAVQRIVDGATEPFRDDFSRRSQPFIDVVKQAQSTSVGTVVGAGLESETADTAQVLVAVSVKTSTVAAPQQDPRAWRMRISVQRVGDQMKVSNVEFVP
jgi:Mce-associated membrane protein